MSQNLLAHEVLTIIVECSAARTLINNWSVYLHLHWWKPLILYCLPLDSLLHKPSGRLKFQLVTKLISCNRNSGHDGIFIHTRALCKRINISDENGILFCRRVISCQEWAKDLNLPLYLEIHFGNLLFPRYSQWINSKFIHSHKLILFHVLAFSCWVSEFKIIVQIFSTSQDIWISL